MMKTFSKLSLIAIPIVFSVLFSPAKAQELKQNAVYVGAGPASSDRLNENTERPLSFGYIRTSSSTQTVWGFDIGAEGTMLDSTWNQSRALSRGTSYNILYGTNLSKSDNFRVDLLGLLGIRESFSECPRSYLGYQCYADRSPDTGYAVNYGALLALTYKQVLLGFRITGESRQIVLGLNF